MTGGVPALRLSAARQVVAKVASGEIDVAEGERLAGFVLLPTSGASRATQFRRLKRLQELGIEIPSELRQQACSEALRRRS